MYPSMIHTLILVSTFKLPDINKARSLVSGVRFQNFSSEPREIVDANFALLSRNRDQNILTLQHLHLKETPPGRERNDCVLGTS